MLPVTLINFLFITGLCTVWDSGWHKNSCDSKKRKKEKKKKLLLSGVFIWQMPSFGCEHTVATAAGKTLGGGRRGECQNLSVLVLSVRGNMRVEAAFHFLSQMFSVPTQNSSPTVTLSVYIHKFNVNVWEIFSVKTEVRLRRFNKSLPYLLT